VAEKLNYLRFVSHFRALHRGTYFQEMKTTAVRKLLPGMERVCVCVCVCACA
jgi:DNA-directed RNA polymerase I subunit RPA2